LGFDTNGVRFLFAARTSGVDFGHAATLGRQGLHLDARALGRVLQQAGIERPQESARELLRVGEGYAEPLLTLLGAEEICSIDASAYEGASVVHDMNQPVVEELKGRFSVVIDGGSLEHVFDFPRAIRNVMEMVRLDGWFLGITPANNFMGHGFYQFSPEVFFRLFDSANGFRTERVLIFEDTSRPRWYEVNDPRKVHRRVELISRHPTYLLVQARKIREVGVLTTPPQQSDYVALWAGEGRAQASHPVRSRIKRLTPGPALRAYRALRAALRPRFNTESYTEVDIREILRNRRA
jgi:hypothetical protein